MINKYLDIVTLFTNAEGFTTERNTLQTFINLMGIINRSMSRLGLPYFMANSQRKALEFGKIAKQQQACKVRF